MITRINPHIPLLVFLPFLYLSKAYKLQEVWPDVGVLCICNQVLSLALITIGSMQTHLSNSQKGLILEAFFKVGILQWAGLCIAGQRAMSGADLMRESTASPSCLLSAWSLARTSPVSPPPSLMANPPSWHSSQRADNGRNFAAHTLSNKKADTPLIACSATDWVKWRRSLQKSGSRGSVVMGCSFIPPLGWGRQNKISDCVCICR